MLEKTVAAEAGTPRLYSIGDLAAEFDLSPRAIRFYEDHGLLSPQRIGGNRVFTARDRARLALVLRGKRLGFALADIKELLDLYDIDEHHLEQLRATRVKCRARIAELERQQREIAETLAELREAESHIDLLIEQKQAAARPAGRKGNPG